MPRYIEFLESSGFTRRLPEYLGDDDYRRLQSELANNPEMGAVMPGTGGFRKMRWADTRRGKGRRGGLRIIYYYFPSEKQIWLMSLYSKDEAADLTVAEKKALKAAIEDELTLRAVRREKRSRGKK
jgi:mRNA-degrading endonuclease RelE of RelBE toxin-antitoxin system